MADSVRNRRTHTATIIDAEELMPDFAFYESTCIFDPATSIRVAAFTQYLCAPVEFDAFLETGYRKFGYRFFKYVCACDVCSSIRIIARDYVPTGSQKRVLKRNGALTFKTAPLSFREEHYELYRKHHLEKGFKVLDRDLFIQEFYFSPVEAFITEISDGRTLVGLGFVDIGMDSLSSVYFFYDPAYHSASPGIFSIIKEIGLSQEMNKKYYYLGLYCRGRRFLGYKDRFSPHEFLDYGTGFWKRCDKITPARRRTQSHTQSDEK